MGRSAGGGGGGGSFGGGAGGGRSFGGGHSSPSGGRSYNGGGFGGPGPGGPGGPHPVGPRPPVGPPIFGPGSFWHTPSVVVVNNNSHNTGSNGGSGSGGDGGSGNNNQGGSGSGCGVLLIVFAVIMLISFAILGPETCSTDDYGSSSPSSGSVAASTVQREALPASAVNETGYYTDADGDWIHNASTLEDGMRYFYKKTGVQPYLYIDENGSVTSSEQITEQAQGLYDQLFDDEGHFLLVFCDDGDGGYYYAYGVGTQAKTVMDDQAVGILVDYLDRYYYDMSLSEEEIFSNTFSKTADRIMTVTGSTARTVTWVIGGVAVVAIIAGVVVIVVKKKAQQREAEAKRTQDILNTPLEKFGSDEVEELAKKYQSDEEKASSSS